MYKKLQNKKKYYLKILQLKKKKKKKKRKQLTGTVVGTVIKLINHNAGQV